MTQVLLYSAFAASIKNGSRKFFVQRIYNKNKIGYMTIFEVYIGRISLCTNYIVVALVL